MGVFIYYMYLYTVYMFVITLSVHVYYTPPTRPSVIYANTFITYNPLQIYTYMVHVINTQQGQGKRP